MAISFSTQVCCNNKKKYCVYLHNARNTTKQHSEHFDSMQPRRGSFSTWRRQRCLSPRPNAQKSQSNKDGNTSDSFSLDTERLSAQRTPKLRELSKEQGSGGEDVLGQVQRGCTGTFKRNALYGQLRMCTPPPHQNETKPESLGV